MTNKQIQDYMHTIVSGLKAAGGGELSKVRKLVTQALGVANEAKSKAARAISTASAARDVADGAAENAASAESVAATARSMASSAQSAANTAKTTADDAKTVANNAKTAAEGALLFNKTQSLTDNQKKTARENIGSGTSSFSGAYLDLQGIPVGIIPTSTNASTTKITVPATNQQRGDYYIGSSTSDINVVTEDYIIKYNGSLYAGARCSINNVQCSFFGNIALLAAAYPDVDVERLFWPKYFNGNKITSKYQYGFLMMQDADFCYVVTNNTAVNTALSVSENTKGFCVSKTAKASASMELYPDYYYKHQILPENLIPSSIQRCGTDLYVKSSTMNSRKWFCIKVDDSGTLSATEVT